MLATRNILFVGLFLILIGTLVISFVRKLRDEHSKGRLKSRHLGLVSSDMVAQISPFILRAKTMTFLISALSIGLLLLIMWQAREGRTAWRLVILTALSVVFLSSYWLIRYWLMIRRSGSFRRIFPKFLITAFIILSVDVLIFLSVKNLPAFRHLTGDSSSADEESIKKLVQESQLYEVRNLYADPTSVSSSELSKYWVPSEQGGKEVDRINASITRLQNQNWHYGVESRPEDFEILSVKLDQPTEGSALVLTSERWFIPLYREDGTRVLERNPYVGPFSVTYTLRKVNGTWLIQDSTVPFQ